MIAEFGDQWYENDWHRELLPDAVRFQNQTDRLERAIRLDADAAPDVTAEDVVLPASVRTVQRPEVFEAVARIYVSSRLGARQIKRQLDDQGVQPPVSLRTVSNYLAMVKSGLAAEDERVETHSTATVRS
jgi:hypothetical protein